MQPAQTVRWIQKLHRISGISLIIFITLKLLSGNAIAGFLNIFTQKTAYLIHYAKWIDIPLVFLFIFHSLFGLLKISFSSIVKNKVKGFYITLIIGCVLFILYILFVYFL
jgi:succinate dehydrogenase/fumarate reductase cytochrome b subunit